MPFRPPCGQRQASGSDASGWSDSGWRHLVLEHLALEHDEFRLIAKATETRSLSHPTRVYPSWASKNCRSRIYPTSSGSRRAKLALGGLGVRGYGLSYFQRPLTRFALDDASHRQEQITSPRAGRGEVCPPTESIQRKAIPLWRLHRFSITRLWTARPK
jgi:hypothetical protein